MDFYEQIVKQKKNQRDWIAITAVVLGGLLFAAVGFFVIPSFFLLWVFIPCWFGYFLITRHILEYEYSLTGSLLDIYRIAAKRRRRKMIEFDLTQTEGRGRVGDSQYTSQLRRGRQVLDFSSRTREQCPYFIVQRPKGTYVVVIEPDETMLAEMSRAGKFQW